MTRRHSRRGKHSSAEEIAATLSDYHKSGLTQSEFCRERGMPLWRLNRWLHRKRRAESTRDARGEPELIRLTLPSHPIAEASRWAYELNWREHHLRLAADFDPAQVRQLLELLRVC